MFRYLLPALIPSWRFFDYIRPAPRIEFAIVANADEPAPRWQEFRPRPDRLSVTTMLRRLLWNPRWNETLFMVTCAEKVLDEPSAWQVDELLTRIAAEVPHDQFTGPSYLRFRIVVVAREGERITEHVRFVSAPRQLTGSAL